VWRALIDGLSPVTPKHPVPMRTTFRDCFLVNFRMAPETLASVLPPPLQPDTYDGKAFLSVVIADMERMRPAFVPSVLGITYQQVVCRAVVRCGSQRGVYFLRSDADNPLMVVMGNLLSFFRFHQARIVRTKGGRLHHFDLVADVEDRGDIHATFDVEHGSRTVPASSVFPNIDTAQRFLVELYTAFRPSAVGQRVSSVDISRGEWNITMVDAPRARFDLMDDNALFPAGSTHLDSVIYVEDIEYFWHTVKHRAG
jgi:uncharacterized protein YqjF (DUF2071 family)